MSTETTTQPKKGVSYALTPDGTVQRNGESIARLDGGKLTWLKPEHAAYQPPVQRFLKAHSIEAEIIPPPTETATIGGTAAKLELATSNDGMAGLTVAQRKAVNHLRAKEGFPIGELEQPAPPAPKRTSGAGDKTPEYVLWLLRYHPAKFVEVYGVEGMGSKEVMELGPPDADGKRRMRRVMKPGFVIARRETILTVKKDTGEQSDDE